MKESEAKKIVNSAVILMQKSRSNAEEFHRRQYDGDHSLREVCELVSPELFGDKSDGFLRAFIKVAEADHIQPIDLYNVCTYIHRNYSLELMNVALETGIPAPDIQWIRGWEPEDA